MYLVCLDFESILIPEIWIQIAKKTNIKGLELTTRDIPNYDILMKRRLGILKTHKIKLKDIQKVIEEIEPFEGAVSFLNWLRKKCRVIILSDTFFEFVSPLIEKLSYPTIFCNSLDIDKNGFIKNYRLRQKNGKQKAVRFLKLMEFKIIAVGDSYNDIGMLNEADSGIFFKPPKSISKEFSQFPVTQSYKELKLKLSKYIN